MQHTVNEARNGGDSVTVALPQIRALLASIPLWDPMRPLVGILRRQLSNYERGDAESRAALKPMILESVDRIEHAQDL